MARTLVAPDLAPVAPHVDQNADAHALARVLDGRRNWLRIDVASRQITADAEMPQEEIAVLDITPAGLRMATVDPIAVGTMFVIFLILPNGQRVYAHAIVTRCTWYGGDVDGHIVTLKF